MKSRAFFFAIIIFLPVFYIHSQEKDYYFRNFNEAYGFTPDVVQCIKKDKRGYVWVGKENGLARFDGFTFKIFKKNDPSTRLPDNNITAIELHPEGYLWLGHFTGGLSLFDPKKNQVICSFSTDSEKKHRLHDDRVLSLYQDGDSLLYIGVHYKFFQVYDLRNDSLYDYAELLDESGINSWTLNVHSFSSDPVRSHVKWMCTGAGLVEFDSRAKRFSLHTFENSSPRTGLMNSMRHIVFAGDSAMYIGSWGGGLVYYNHKQKFWKNYLYDHRTPLNGTRNIIRMICSKNAHQIWIATHDSCVGYFDIPTEKFFFFKHQPDDQYSINEGEYYCLLTDDEELWIGGMEGLSLFYDSHQLVTKFDLGRHSELFKRTFYPYTLWYESASGNLIIGHRDSEYIESLHTATGKAHIQARLSKMNTVTAVLPYEGHYYITTFRDGVWVWNGRHLRRIDFHTTHPIHAAATYQGVCAPDGTLYLATYNQGLVIANETDKSYQSILPGQLALHNDELPGGLLSVMLDRNSRVWCGGHTGIAIYDPMTKQVGTIRTPAQDLKLVMHIFELSRDTIAAITARSGVFLLTGTDGNIQKIGHLREGHTLVSDQINSSAMDASGRLYLLTPLGIQVLDIRRNQSFLLNRSNGLKSINKIQKIHVTDDGFLNISLPGQLQRISIAHIEKLTKAHISRIVLSALEIMNTHEVTPSEHLMLRHHQNYISFALTSFMYSAIDNVEYQYRLNGLDTNWLMAISNRGTFTNLPAGEYVLEVRARLSTGAWTEPDKVFSLVIVPPYWQTWWFRLLMAGLIALTGLMIYRGRVAQIRKENLIKSHFEKRLVEVKLEALRAQMNPHFLFNSLNSINYYILTKKDDLASEYLTKFSQLLRMVLMNSRSETISLDDELKMLELYCSLEAMRFEDKFTFAIRVGGEIEPAVIQIPPMVIQPFVENAIWHGLLNLESGKGTLEISVEKKNDNLLIVVEDNGIGRKKAMELKSKTATKHKSYGLQITSERFEMIKKNLSGTITFKIKDLVCADGHAAGTRVEIYVTGITFMTQKNISYD